MKDIIEERARLHLAALRNQQTEGLNILPLKYGDDIKVFKRAEKKVDKPSVMNWVKKHHRKINIGLGIALAAFLIIWCAQEAVSLLFPL